LEIELLKKKAFDVRKAIEDQLAISTNIDRELINFPSGSCEVSSEILGLYLKSIGFKNVVKCRGSRLSSDETYTQFHLWLLVDESIIVDITADQFEECSERVLVVNRSKFHNTFSDIQQRELSYENLCAPIGKGYKDFYKAVIAQLGST